MIDERTAQAGRNWRRYEPALARQCDDVSRTMAEDERTWRPVWGEFVVGLAERVAAGRPLSRSQSHVLTRALREAHARRMAAGLPPTGGVRR